ncbi:hypothetical protein PsorP6_000927 [Peronosclerospora sorghi]|uniref:Uncharacterized protein n=1 Tax=Peronosclerospora sorghi TaxID=230839 RepID=A0ACC0WQB4_9STRA|nr:hypothetical protein PsorP6_000927 [Peronosclerospora sorghi]
MREAVCTFIWSASSTDIPELREVKKQLTKKYGQDVEAAAVRNRDGCVNERVIQKLSVQPPSAFLVVNYMKRSPKSSRQTGNPMELKTQILWLRFRHPQAPQLLNLAQIHHTFLVSLPVILALKQLQQLQLPCKLLYRGARWTITRLSQRTFTLHNKLLNMNAVTGSHSLIKQHKLRKRLGILLLPHHPHKVMRLTEYQILTSLVDKALLLKRSLIESVF